ncbi:MAG TPA: tail fiber domain-containing protein [Verrucomicrobiae bacterium]|jgi:hypothetical protein|nr:tail fiber domain-containing protein [Verrucomicrobiae bacterium]
MKTILNHAWRHGLALILIAAGFWPARSHAQTSQYMSYQGYLTDGNGNALGSTNTGPKAYDVVFRIWDAPTGGNEVFSELQTVTVDNGYFSVLLGQGTAYSLEPTLHVPLANVFTNVGVLSRYVELTVLGIGVNNFITILPRLQLVAAPYAFQAANAVNSLNAVYITGTNAIGATNFSTNVGVWTASGTNIYRTGGNIGINTSSPAYPLDFGSSLGEKISLYSGGVSHYGFGIQPSLFQMYSQSDMAFGTGSSSSFSEAMRIKSGGAVGIGTSNPGSTLDVNGNIQIDSAGGGHLIFNNANAVLDWNVNGTLFFRSDNVQGNINSYNNVMTLSGNGSLAINGASSGYVFTDRTVGYGETWVWYAQNGNAGLFNSVGSKNYLTITSGGNCGIGNLNPTQLLTVGSGGAYCNGTTWVNGSDVKSKHDIRPVNPQQILEQVSALPISKWEYNAENQGVDHVGPMAQDFHAAFGLNGADDKHISTVDEGGIALAAIQGLHQEVQEKNAELKALQTQVQELKSAVQELLKATGGERK